MENNTIINDKSRDAFVVRTVTNKKGGFREKEIFRNPHRLEKSETWNDDHKIVNVIAYEADESGHSAAYAVDVVTRRICG